MDNKKRARVNSTDSDDMLHTNDMDLFWGEFKLDKKKDIVYLDNSVYSVGTEIHFTCEINKTTIQEIIKQITTIITDNLSKYTGSSEKLTITYVVDSPGGSVTSILKFVDFIKITKQKYEFVEFVSVISGLAASAGTIMAVVADKRFMTKHAYAMIHELSSGNNGKFTHMRSYIKFLEGMHRDLLDIYQENSDQDREVLEGLLKDESWFSAKEYMELGFVDEIKG